MKLFLFYDDVEEIVVAATDREDAFKVVEEKYGKEAADLLIMSHMLEYPPDFELTARHLAANIADDPAGRRVAVKGGPGHFRKPLPTRQPTALNTAADVLHQHRNRVAVSAGGKIYELDEVIYGVRDVSLLITTKPIEGA